MARLIIFINLGVFRLYMYLYVPVYVPDEWQSILGKWEWVIFSELRNKEIVHRIKEAQSNDAGD